MGRRYRLSEKTKRFFSNNITSDTSLLPDHAGDQNGISIGGNGRSCIIGR